MQPAPGTGILSLRVRGERWGASVAGALRGGARAAVALALVAGLLVTADVRVEAVRRPRTLSDLRPVTAAVVEPGFPVDHLGVVWDGEEGGHQPGDNGWVRLRHGRTWGPWVPLIVEGATAPGQWASGLVSGGDADAYQVRGVPGHARAVRAMAINVTDGPLEVVGTRPAGTAAALQRCVSRSEWGADESLRRGSRSFAPAQVITVHHTATANDDANPAATVRAIHRYHVEANGWDDIGYQYLVDEAGRIYEGRWSGAGSVRCSAGGDGRDFAHDDRGQVVTGAHVGGHNTGNIGIAAIGTFTAAEPRYGAIEALEDALAELAARHGLDPEGTTVYSNGATSKRVRVISGHRDYSATDCPGDRLYARLPSIRSDTAAKAARLPGGDDGREVTQPGSPPSTPTGVAATAGDASATVRWSPPAQDGSAAVTAYTVTATPGGRRASVEGATTSALVSGLRNGTSYTFTVVATNAAGDSPPSAPSSAVVPGVRFDGDPATTERLDRGDPVAAAVGVSQSRFPPGGATHAILSRDDVFADSLAGTALTGRGPLLLTDSGALPSATREELRRALPDGATVFLLGGRHAIDDRVADALAGDGLRVQRLAGATRVETALAVASEVRRRHPASRVLLARAHGTPTDPTAAWADSVTGGARAAAVGTPMLLTPSDGLHDAVRAWLSADGTTETVLLGGRAALSEVVAAAVPGPRRVAGPAREDTAVAVAHQLWGAPASGARRFVVLNAYRADGWAFGLAAAGLAADAAAPALVVHTDTVPDVTATAAGTCGGPEVDLLLVGSTAVISASRQAELDAADGGTC
ncbi:MAG TPA: cell wall-binding repeat-containing protein [Nitriliruptorales bacterium]|nr:cell wall-binding repeat-containing protein [Nitriliruptorales bacterium]